GYLGIEGTAILLYDPAEWLIVDLAAPGIRKLSVPYGLQRLPVLKEARLMLNDMQRRLTAEFFGTFWLVFGGCGSAVVAAAYPQLGIGFMGVAFAFGLTVLTMAYAVGHISGGHFNPAVSLGLWSAGRCADRHVVPYIVAQVVGAIVAAAALWLIASSKPGWSPGGFAAHGYGDLSPGQSGLFGALCIAALTTIFLP